VERHFAALSGVIPAKALAGRQYGTAVDGKKAAQCGFSQTKGEHPAETGL
jgi:hypothetical protein